MVGSLQVDVGGQNREVPRAALMAQTAFIFTNSSECSAAVRVAEVGVHIMKKCAA